MVDQGSCLGVLLLELGHDIVKVAPKLVVPVDPKLLDRVEGTLDLDAHAVHRVGGQLGCGLEVVAAAHHSFEEQAVVVDGFRGRRSQVLLVALRKSWRL